MNILAPETLTGIDNNTPDNQRWRNRRDIVMSEHGMASDEHHLQALSIAFEITGAGFWEWNIATGEIMTDRQWAAISGYNPENNGTMTIEEWKTLCHPDDIDTAIASLCAIASGNKNTLELELRIRRNNGNWIHVLDRAKALWPENSDKPSFITGTRQLFCETDKAATSQNSERELRSLMDNIPGAVYHIDASGRTSILSRMPDFLSTSIPDDQETASFDMIGMIHPEDRQKVSASFRKLRDSKQSDILLYRIITPEKTIHWVEDHKTSTFSDEGLYTGVDGILCDVSDRIASQDETRRLESQLRKSQRLETIGTLAGGIAHDFNNILTPILGYSEMGLTSVTEDNPLHDYLSEIMQAAERAQKLVAQILTFSRAQDGRPVPVNIRNIITEALKLLRPSLPSTITIEQQISPTSRNVLADPSRIHQVIINLCTNAFHAMEHSGGTLNIGLKEIHPGSSQSSAHFGLNNETYIELTVSDTGTGMDETIMERIFEPFFTTKSIEKGAGLGLSVVHGIVTGANGQITVESIKGQGSTFHVYLPVIDEQPRRDAAEKIHPRINAGNVLFVDDEPAAVQMMTIMMTKLGFNITAEQSPVEALRRFREKSDQFDLVITDLTMPEMTGIQLAGELQKISPTVPVILMTGYGKIIDQDTPLSHYGISRLIKKPVRLVQLASTINEVLSVTNHCKS